MASNISTIQSLIDYGKKLKIYTKDLHFKQVIVNSTGEKIVVNTNALYERFYDLLLDTAVTIALTDEEYLKYRLKPRLLSNDVYGTPELYFMILKLNHMVSITEFDNQVIRLFGTELIDLLREIMIKQQDDYILNEVEIIHTLNKK